MRKIGFTLLLIASGMLGACDLFDDEEDDDEMPENPADMPYEFTIDPDDFVNVNITGNTFFPLATGKVFTYEGEDEDGAKVRVVSEWTTDTKIVAGVTCVVMHDQAYEDDELVEDTYDWFAQDTDGNVWYFGEDSRELEDGEVVSTEGSWEAGVDGALPGVIMFAEPIVGLWNRQEYYEGVAEDVGMVLSMDATVSVPYGQYQNCLQVAEWNLNEPGVVEHKFYAANVGLVKTLTAEGPSSNEDLVEIE